VSWGGSLGMDAERAPLGHGWPVGACPPHGTGANVPPRSGGRTPAQRFWLLLAPKVTRPSGRNLTQQRPDAVGATRFQAQCFDLQMQQTCNELTEVTRAAKAANLTHRCSQPSAAPTTATALANNGPMTCERRPAPAVHDSPGLINIRPPIKCSHICARKVSLRPSLILTELIPYHGADESDFARLQLPSGPHHLRALRLAL